jgi:hypothetical protein
LTFCLKCDIIYLLLFFMGVFMAVGDYKQMGRQVKKMKEHVKEKDPAVLYKEKVDERKKKMKIELMKLYDMSEYCAWSILHEDGNKKEILTLEGIYLDIIDYACEKFDKNITPTSVIKISKTNVAKKIDADSVRVRKDLMKKKELLEEELKKINDELLKFE